MNITLANVGKRYNSEWIFNHLDYEFKDSGKYAITGPNGSGKSTVLQVIGGYLQHNKGTITYIHQNTRISPENIYKYVSMAAPYLEVIEEMTLKEFLVFHRQMKGLMPGISIDEIAESVSLKPALNKQIRYYSSGMKQRVKLAQAIFGDTPLILLDEPLTNLDDEGIKTYHSLIEYYTKEKIVIISSNDEKEFHFCNKIIDVTEFKQNDNS